jgi:hypothetical protein
MAQRLVSGTLSVGLGYLSFDPYATVFLDVAQI